MSKHTKGPWEYFPATNYEGFAIAPRGTLPTLAAVRVGCKLSNGERSHVIEIECFNFPGETEANAKLVAAAPELLATCRALLEELRLIRMKDTQAVYDITCRVAAHALIRRIDGVDPAATTAVEPTKQPPQYHCVCWGAGNKCCHCGDDSDVTEVCEGNQTAKPCDEARR